MKAALVLLTLLLLIGSVTAAPLSVIDSSYLTFDSGIGGPVWLVNVRGDNDASYIVFGDNTQVKGTVEGQTATAKEDFTLTQNIDSESCEYALVNTLRNDIYQYKIDLTNANVLAWTVNDYIQECYNSPGGVLAWGETGISLGLFQDVYCLRENKIANAGEVLTGKINFKSSFTLQKGTGTPITKQVTTLAENANEIPTAISFSDGTKTVARIRWIGGSTFGEVCPVPDNYVAIETSGKWYTTDKDAYTLYNDQYVLLQEQIKKVRSTDQISNDERLEIRRMVTAITERGSQALTERKISLGGTNAITSGAKSVLQLPRDHLIYAPDFQILLNADWLGITFLNGKPKIIDAKFNSCSEEGENSVYATIENVGQQEGLFLISMTCQPGLVPDATQRTLKLKPAETGTVTIPFSLDLSTDASKSCTIQVADSQITTNQDRKLVSASCQASIFCTVEAQKNCFGTIEKICQQGQWVDTGSDACSTAICNRDGDCDGKEGESFEICGGKLASDNDCSTCNLNDRCEATETTYSCPSDCGEVKEETALWIYILGGVVLAGAAYFGATMIKPTKGKKKKGGR